MQQPFINYGEVPVPVEVLVEVSVDVDVEVDVLGGASSSVGGAVPLEILNFLFVRFSEAIFLTKATR
jgi:hypothetical protein